MILNFDKYISLPSGGLIYPPDVYANKIDINYKFFQNDINAYDSFFESIVLTVKKYCSLPIHISELLLYDLYFLYSYLYISYIKLDDEYIIADMCKKCKKINIIKIKFSNITIKYYNKYLQKNIIDLNYKNEEKKFILNFGLRKVKHNFEYSYLKFQNVDNDDILKTLIYYILPQIENIYYKQTIVDKNLYYDFFNNVLNKNIVFDIYTKLINFNHIYGLNNKIKYNCIDCKHINETSLFDEFVINEITPRYLKNYNSKVEEDLKVLFETSKLPIFLLEDVLKLPLNLEKHIYKVLTEIKFYPNIL